MEVRIRLQKAGKPAKGSYNFRIVAMPRANKRDGRHLEIIGHYDPAKEPAVIVVDEEKLNKWLSRGAQMSDTVKSLVRKAKKKQKE